MKKMTRIEALTLAMNALTDNAEALEVLTAIRDSIEKANSRKSDKPTKTQVENAAIKGEMLKAITVEGVRCGEIANAVGISSQKAAALLTQMVKDGLVVKAEGPKRVTLFKLAE